jgi:hypothetical protein
MFNSIGLITNQDDFLERTTLYHVPPLETDKYKDLSQLENDFQKEIPNFYGAFLITLSNLLRHYNDKDYQPKSLGRLQTFDRIGYSLLKSLGYDDIFFQKIKKATTDELNSIKDEENDFLNVFYEYFKEKRNPLGFGNQVKNEDSFVIQDSASAIFQDIINTVDPQEVYIPFKNVKQFAKRLKREHKTLINRGIYIKKLPRNSKGSRYHIEYPINKNRKKYVITNIRSD